MAPVCTCSERPTLRPLSGGLIWDRKLSNFTEILPRITNFGTTFPRPLRGEVTDDLRT